MAKILVLGLSGSGKSTSISKNEKLSIIGLDPKETFIIACTNKDLPFRGWKNQYKRAKVIIKDKVVDDVADEGNYYQTNNAISVANLIIKINEKRNDINNIVIDDSNYMFSDYYMANSMKGGYGVFNKIGFMAGRLFAAIESVNDKNVILMGHYQEYRSKTNDEISYKYKVPGTMVDKYTNVEGKFSIVLFADQEYNDQTKIIEKFFITNYDGTFPAKTGYGLFSDLHIKNDLGYVLMKIKEYETGTVPETTVEQ